MATSLSISSSDCDGHGSVAGVDGDAALWLGVSVFPLFLLPITGELV